MKESTRAEIIDAIAEVLSDIGLAEAPGKGDDNATPAAVLADLLDWHGVNWERWRDFMRPRMMRVLPSHLPDVWAAYVRLAVIDLALRIAGKVHMGGVPLSSLHFLEWATSGRRGRYLNQKRIESGITLFDFAEVVGVTFNAAEAWVYSGTRPSDENLRKIAVGAVPGKRTPRDNTGIAGTPQTLLDQRRRWPPRELHRIGGNGRDSSPVENLRLPGITHHRRQGLRR